MRPRAREVSVPAILVFLAMGLASCGGSSDTPNPPPPSVEPTTRAIASPSPAPEATSTPEAAPERTAEATATLDSDTFVSELYPYAITYPPGTMLLGWHAAERAWDVQAPWDMAGPYPDVNLIAEGGLYIFGAPTAGLDEFLSAIEANGTRHRCTEPQDRREATINGVAAIGFTQVCDNGTAFARVILVKDGYGIAMFVNTRPGGEVAGRDKAMELLEGLEWRTG